MFRTVKLAALAATATLAFAAPALAQNVQDDSRLAAAQDRFDREVATYRAEVDRYRAIRNDRRGGGYRQQSYDDRDEDSWDAQRYYRDGSGYRERVLSENDRVYRGNDGRYYCRRSDGTAGLIVGAAGGGILGNVIDGGRSRTVGTLLGAAVGALAGRAVERSSSENSIRCR